MENQQPEENIKATIGKVSNSAHEAVDKIAGVTYQAAEVLGEKGEQLKNAEMEMMEDYRTYVRENPMKSVGIAVAAGFFLSRMMGSGQSDHQSSQARTCK
ncbi:DUF883 domain-containing protein [Methylobacter sp.]|uniref:DUF883 family protein n=1 Tax=Methylobacter sp. TaxID=2051955 RepID=UPI0011FADD15|nr:DUF883 domain-containing protein [Methylobacter sp.]TAK60589.1 MAG: DUF883 domain-containing protein [Methylobacter sp.]